MLQLLIEALFLMLFIKVNMAQQVVNHTARLSVTMSSVKDEDVALLGIWERYLLHATLHLLRLRMQNV